METFTERLRYLVELKKIKQTEFADQAGFNTVQVNKWLAGNTKSPQKKTLKKIRDFFGCNIEWLSTGEGQPFCGLTTAENESKFQEMRGKQLAEEERGSINRVRFKMQCGSVYFDEFFDFIAEEYGEGKEGVEGFLQWLHTNHAVYRHWLAEKKEDGRVIESRSQSKVSNSD